jgi:hypothetical protein
MASIEEVRSGIALAVDKASESLGALQQAYASLEQALGVLVHATEGSPQADVSQATSLFSQAVGGTQEVQQAVRAGIDEAEGVANRL